MASPLEYKIRRATRATDPDCEWIDGNLVISLQGEELDAVVLTTEEKQSGVRLAQERNLALEHVLLKLRLQKGAKNKFEILRQVGRIPPNPADTSFHRRPTVVLPQPQQGASGSLFGSLYGAAKQKFFGTTDTTVEPWVTEACQLYEIPTQQFGEPAIFILYRELEKDITSDCGPNSSYSEEECRRWSDITSEKLRNHPELQNQPVAIGGKKILLSPNELKQVVLDPSEEFLPLQQRIKAAGQKAFEKKILLLIKLGLISKLDRLAGIISPEFYKEERADLDISHISEINQQENSINPNISLISGEGERSIDDGNIETEESEKEDSQLEDPIEDKLEIVPPPRKAGIIQRESLLVVSLWPAFCQQVNVVQDSYWSDIVKQQRALQPDSSADKILKTHLLQQFEDSHPRKFKLTREDIVQQIKLELDLQPQLKFTEDQWDFIAVRAAGRKLKLALEVGAVEDPNEEFEGTVELSLLEIIEQEYHQGSQDYEPEIIMTEPSPASVYQVDLMIEEMRKLKSDIDQHRTTPMDIDDVEQGFTILQRVQVVNNTEMNKILEIPGLLASQVQQYGEKGRKMMSQRTELEKSLLKIKRTLPEPERPNRQNQRQAAVPSVKVMSPKIQIRTFSGGWNHWMEFQDQINEFVVKPPEDQMPNAQKFQLLRQSLDGKALDIIRGIPITGANFARAWKALCDTYNNEARLKEKYHDAIANVKPMHSASASQLRAIHTSLNEAREALTALGATAGDDYIVSRLVSGFDAETRNHYEMRARPAGQNPTQAATWDEVTAFVNQRCIALDNIRHNTRDDRGSAPRKSTAMTTQRTEYSTPRDSGSRPAEYRNCRKCGSPHPLWKCEAFRQLSVAKRTDFVKEFKLCFICLGSGHRISTCTSKHRCATCKKKHNSLLNIGNGGHSASSPRQRTEAPGVQSLTTYKEFSTVILPTARVWVEDSVSGHQSFRALLDTGSQSSFITERAVQYLRLRRHHASIEVTGIGNGAAARSKGYVNIKIRTAPNASEYMETSVLILPTVMADTPTRSLPLHRWENLRVLKLADPDFGLPGRVDLVLGADVAFRALTGERIVGHSDEPVAHATCFGWVIGGSSGTVQPTHRISANLATVPEISTATLQQFWGAEGLCEEQLPDYQKDEDRRCEEIFKATTMRLPDGKSQVCFPFKNDPLDIGPSRAIGIRRLAGTEARLARDPGLRAQYEAFMDDYESQGHMAEVKTSEELDVYLPHHPIIRQTALTTKLRVVFDASAKTANGNSLNSQQLVGPVIQDDLFSILTRFRLHRIAINGDIAQMYRQIWIHPDHRKFQKILWRRKPSDAISEFQLNTVTYGTASAPWLATRALKYIAELEQEKHPEAARIIAEDHYMDDLLSGADSPEKAHRIQDEVSKILLSYGLPLRKWASNNEYVIRAISGEQDMLTNPDEVVKTLGLKWDSKKDHFQFKVKLKESTSLTKRAMISEIACTFDPLGFAAPVIIVAKMLYQQVWATKTEWDQPLPEDLAKQYQTFREKLGGLESISLPRWLGTLSADDFELHAFTDASEKAYGACIYLRVCGSSGVVTNLVAAKTRVAPLSTISLPRLELMGAVLGAKLMNQVIKAFRRPVKRKFYWTDSMITLAWIQAEPARFKTFIANRVALIQELSSIADWNHVGTKDNPADLASRGIMPQELIGEVKQMWFQGPPWFREGILPAKKDIPVAEEECKKIQALHAITEDNEMVKLIEKTSSFTRLWRITAWMLRYITNYRLKKINKAAKLNLSPNLSPEEKQRAIERLIYVIQQQTWPQEFKALTADKTTNAREALIQVMKKSSINNLNPFVDEHGILRVGGRLENSNREFASKHPAIVPYGHLAQIYLQDLHIKSMHAGPTLLLATARQNVWFIRGPQVSREVVKKCVDCTRWRGETMYQQMGNLPASRTEGYRAFHITGVDYAGPVLLKARKGRGGTTIKGWISLFVCFASKAIHLELVSELTSEAFIAALRRFVARRGLPKEIHSDNGTNFVGADKELKTLLMEQKNQQQIVNACLQQGIEWKFIPPSAPHQGGLWEAAVKSIKHHLRRVLGASQLTFEEYSTVLAQIEAQVNSRPLSPLTEDVTNLDFLTPGHFLIGQPITAVPDPSLVAIKENRLSRWQYLQRLHQNFWLKWSQDYLSAMQKRNKWKLPQTNINVGDLVIIKEDNVAPTQWRKGRLLELHTGKDDKTRVVTLRTSAGEMKRPIVKLIPLG